MNVLNRYGKKVIIYMIPALIIAWAANEYFVSVYRVDGSSMGPAINSGELILANKMLDIRLNRYWPWREGHKKDTKLKNSNRIKAGEVLLFEIGDANTVQGSVFLKRCVGMPGDTLTYYTDHVTVGNRSYPFHGSKLTVPEGSRSALFRLRIPVLGDTLRFDPDREMIWKDFLRMAGITVNHKDGRVFIDGEESQYWINTQNWYFLVGDNLADSFDSRVLGLIPENRIIGKATMVLWPPPIRFLN